jgi:hypothetical protein
VAKPTLTAYELNTVYAAYSKEYVSKEIHNQFYKVHPVLDFLRKKGKSMPGGRTWRVNVQDGLTPLGDPFLRNSVATYTAADPVTVAVYEMVQYREPVVLYDVDLAQATGPGAVFSYMQEQIDGAAERLRLNLVTDLMATSTATNGVTALAVAIDATGSLGGINPATAGQDWWASQENSSGSFATQGLDDMRTTWDEVTQYKRCGEPELITGDSTFIKALEEASVGHFDIVSSTGAINKADLGIARLFYKGAPCVRDPNHTSGVVYFLNSYGIQLAERSGKALEIGEWVDGRPGGVFGKINDIFWYGQLVVKSRACLGKMTGVTA